MVEIVTSKADDAVMVVTVDKFLAETASRERCDPYDLFSKLLRIENPGLMGTFHGRCSCPLHLPAAVRGKQRKGKDARYASESTNFIVSATTELLRSTRHAPRYRERLLHALTRG
jgi:hypothetical protein